MRDNIEKTDPIENESMEVVTADEAIKLPRFKTMLGTMQQTKQLVDFFQSTWDNAKEEFGITDDQMAKLIEYNNATRVPRGDDQTEEDYDDLNGLLGVPMERLEEIFGKGSKLFGVDHSQTIDRVRYAANLFEQLFMVLREYRQAEETFSEAIDDSEKRSIEYLQRAAEDESDPEKRERARASLDSYMKTKYLGFLTELSEADQGRIVSTFFNEQRLKYLLERGRNQLVRAKIPEMIILELSGFEKRCLSEKYHSQNNLMLLTLLQLAGYGKPADNPDVKRRISALTIGLDRLIRKQLTGEDLDRTMANILAFEDMFVDQIAEHKVVEFERK